MQKALEIRDEFYKGWVDEFGLGLLEPGKLTDNGALWLSMFQALCHLCGVYDDGDAHWLIEAASKIKKGADYKRRPNDERTDAHDNMAGIVTGYVLAGRLDLIGEICDSLDKTGGVSDHTNGSKWSLKQMRQGSEIAFYRICCGRIPFLVDMAWLTFGIVFNAAFGNVSSKNLGWLRCFALNRAGYKHLPRPYRLALDGSMLIRELILITRNQTPLGTFRRYFVANHPIIKLSELAAL